MQILRRVLFHVQARNPDFLCPALNLDFERAASRQRQFIHRNLVALRQIRIKIILPRKPRPLMNPRLQRKRRPHRQLHRLAVQHRQRARQTQAHRTRILIRRVSKSRRAPAERFRLRLELRVHLQPNDRLVASHHLRRNTHLLSDSCHKNG